MIEVQTLLDELLDLKEAYYAELAKNDSDGSELTSSLIDLIIAKTEQLNAIRASEIGVMAISDR